jgi:hypothetical protein
MLLWLNPVMQAAALPLADQFLPALPILGGANIGFDAGTLVLCTVDWKA